MNLSDLQALAAQIGFPDPALAAAVAMAESHGVASATNIVTAAQAAAWNAANPGQPPHGPERSFGLWQINALVHTQYNETSLLDPTYNAQAAYSVSNKGTNWNPWSTFTSGIYKQFYQPTSPAAPAPGIGGALIAAAVIVGAGAVVAYYIQRPARSSRYAHEPSYRTRNPYKSDAQRRYLHVVHPEIAARWDAEIRRQRRRG